VLSNSLSILLTWLYSIPTRFAKASCDKFLAILYFLTFLANMAIAVISLRWGIPKILIYFLFLIKANLPKYCIAGRWALVFGELERGGQTSLKKPSGCCANDTDLIEYQQHVYLQFNGKLQRLPKCDKV
jgi:hypothetical protein